MAVRLRAHENDDDVTAVRSPADSPGRMQRLRVGLTGLASVGLAIVVATAVASGVQRRVTVARAPVATPAANESEPLAQLGAAPGAGDAEKAKATPSGR